MITNFNPRFSLKEPIECPKCKSSKIYFSPFIADATCYECDHYWFPTEDQIIDDGKLYTKDLDNLK